MRIRTMRASRIATVGVVAAMVATALLAATGVAAAKSQSASAPKTSTRCSVITDDHWPTWVQGRPGGIDPRTTAAIYMWHDSGGWHIRVTHHTTNKRTFAGQLVTGGALANVKAVHLEKNDQFNVSSDKHSVSFLFRNYGAIDGIDFRTHCAPSITFTFQSDGATAPASKIVIGQHGAHPSGDPFVITR